MHFFLEYSLACYPIVLIPVALTVLMIHFQLYAEEYPRLFESGENGLIKGEFCFKIHVPTLEMVN